MKKLLLFLLLLPLFAHAQDPKPPTPIILGSQFYKSITGSDTSYYVFDTKTSLWRRLVTYRESILPFTNNFKLLGDTVDLADTIHALHSFINVDTLHPVAKFLGYNRSTNPSSIVEFWQDGVLKAFEGEAGGHYGSGIAYISGQDYSLVSTELTGTTISRNRADTNTVFKLKNYALSGHADFLNVQNGLVKIDYLGVPTFHGIKDTTGIDTVVTIKNGKFYKGLGGGGGGNTIYTGNDSLTSNRIVKFVSHKLEFGDLTNNKAYLDIDPTTNGVNIYTYATDNNSSFSMANDGFFISNSNPGSGYSANFQVSGNDGSKAAAIVSAGPSGSNTFQMFGYGESIFTDAISSKGILYANNYGANFTDRSLVDKRYVDSLAGTITPGSGTVTSVAATGANGIGVSGSPITTSGTLALSLGNITPTSISTIVKPATTFQTGAGTAYTDSLVVKTSGGLTAISPNSYLHSPTIAGHGLVNGFNTTLAQLAYGYGVVLQSGTSVYDGSGGSTFRVDTGATIQTVANFFPKGDTRYAKTGSTGTVTSIATSSATGILGGTITSTGTISADTTVLRTVANSRSLAQTQTALNLKANLASPTFTGTVTIPSGGVFGTPTSMTATNVTGLPLTTGVTGVLPNANTTAVSTATASTIALRDASGNVAVNSVTQGYTTTATAAGTTTLTVASTPLQYFTGTTTQTVLLPVTSTLVLGQQFLIVNNSTGAVTVQSSGTNTIQAMIGTSSAIYTCILTSGTTVASWSVQYFPAVNFATGTFTGDGSVGNPFTLAIDATPTSSSLFPVQSGGVFTALAAKMTNPMTTMGDIIVGGSGGTPTRLAIGGANAILHGGSTPAYSAIVNGDIAASTIDLTAKVTGLLPVANGGTGTASPGIVAGTNITVTGTWPNQTVTASGGGSVANPTATIGLTAINGSASSAIRSDGAPALSQAISPTWTGQHIFNASITASSALGQGTYFNNGISAAANNDFLIGTDFQNNFISNSKTGLLKADVRILSNGSSNINLVIKRGSGTSNEVASGTGNEYNYVGNGSGANVTYDAQAKPYMIWQSAGTNFGVLGSAGIALTAGGNTDFAIQVNNNLIIGTGAAKAPNTEFFSTGRTFFGTSPTDDGVNRVQVGGSIISGVAGTTIGTYNLAGNTSGTISIKPQAAAGTYEFDMPITAGTAGQVLTSQGGAGTAQTWSTASITQASADLTAQSAAGNVTTFTVGASTATFNISSYINVTAVSVDVIQGQITYTDENNTAQTVSLANISAIGNSTYSPITIRAKNATVITVKTNLTTGAGSITFDTGARITQL